MYEGEWVNGKLHGHGKVTFPNQDTYEGQFKYGKKHGNGRLTCGSITYEGRFRNDSKHGNGTLTNSDGRIMFKGTWRNGTKHEGKKTYPSGKYYDGSWYRNKKHGFGKEETTNGTSYTGQYVLGKRNGHGCMDWPSGDSFDGYWQADKMVFVLSKVYVGQFKRGVHSGQGEMTCASDIYRGGWKKGLRHGYGMLKEDSGIVYSGLWFNGEKDDRMSKELSLAHISAHLDFLLKGEHPSCVTISSTDKRALALCMKSHAFSFVRREMNVVPTITRDYGRDKN